jgi:RNA polymerase sigma-70 factor (ECF subfamily)
VVDDEFVLVQQLRNGEAHAFNTIYLQYYKRLCAFASQYVSFAEREEVVQDVMAWLWDNRAMLAPDTNMKSFLFAAVKHKCINKNTHQQIKNKVLENIYIKYASLFEEPNHYEEQELMNLLNETLRNIPKEYREAFTLNRFESLTYNEIAERFGVSSKTIAYRISRTLRILREELKDYLISIFFLNMLVYFFSGLPYI